jgi:Fe-S-cluster-containing dehydrogenase component
MNPDRDPSGRPNDPDAIFGSDWEAEARKTMEPTGWDPDLAVRVARDALRLVSGEISEQDFRDRYHQDYLRTFGLDNRPADSEDEDPTATEPELVHAATAVAGTGSELIPGDAIEVLEPGIGKTQAVSRRTALKIAGGGATALFLVEALGTRVGQAESETPAAGHGSSPAAGAQTNGKKKVQMGMVVDLTKCDGCLMCVGACKEAYGLPDGVHWIYVLAFQEPERPDATNLLVRTCQHCSNAPCVKVCPTTARHRRDDGLVLTDYDLCFGCRYCQVSCPYGVNYFGWSNPKNQGGGFTGERKDARGKSVIGAPPKGVMGKCTFCPQKADAHHSRDATHCSDACPHGVLHYGNLNDPESEPMQYLKARIEESNGQLSTFRLLDDLGTKPNVIYIGHQPSRSAKAVDGPVRYEDWGFVHERRAVLEGPEPWFKRLIGR